MSFTNMTAFLLAIIMLCDERAAKNSNVVCHKKLPQYCTHAMVSLDLSSDLFCFVPYLAILSALAPKTNHMFHHTGNRQSTPNCPVLLVANFNPGTGSQSYSSSGKKCDRASHYRLPFFLKDMGPRYNAISVAAHEARPGHHTQVDYLILSIASLIS